MFSEELQDQTPLKVPSFYSLFLVDVKEKGEVFLEPDTFSIASPLRIGSSIMAWRGYWSSGISANSWSMYSSIVVLLDVHTQSPTIL